MTIAGYSDDKIIWSLLPDPQTSRPIPKGAKVLLRWDDDNKTRKEKHHKHRHHHNNNNNKHQNTQQHPPRRPSIIANYPSTSSSYSYSPNQFANTFRSRTALDRSPVSFISSSELTAKNFEENIEEHLFPSGLLLFSFCGFLLVFLVGIFLFRIFKSSEREMLSSSHSRELQIVLVPKNRLIKNSPIFPVKEENLEEEQKELLNEQQQPVISGRKLFPKRIYEIQAEEGYYSCPPSMRASFEAD
uniref:Uncharacterized protein n=1 Tax=Meloidogyne enterolobii TaxID=390850 RepID=A0A6V7TY32_MELEN|nr:unnamed protein product [Meloidogyne enterolobii]